MNPLLKTAFYLGIFTIIYNIIEGSVSVGFGLEDDTLALLGFGVDSFVEVISGLGITHMIWRMNKSEVLSRDSFERTALKITGTAFYILAAGLVTGSIINILKDVEPETTIIGIIVSVISLATMYYLMKAKLKVGRQLNSDAIIADANCTKTCFYLSIILLLSSGLYELFKVGYLDILGSLGIAYYAVKEGREAFEKSKSNNLLCCCDDNCRD
ncbi:MAG: cation transporter [Melioribacteraceae bacterium]|nr:cation transporter [Melioribacteraceae bacterium]